MRDLGSIEWTRQTGGLLETRRERLQLMLQVLRLAIDRAGPRMASIVGDHPPPVALDLSTLPVPDTHASRAAEQLLADTMAPTWINHSHRTYAWGYAIGRHEGLRFDAELLYIASLVHDLSLIDSNVAVQPHCFSLPAAWCADEIALRAGWDASRRHLIADAITRHINLWIPAQKHPEAYLLHVGAKLDGVGLRYSDLSPALVADVVARYPRGDFRQVFRAKLRAHGAAVPRSRAAFYARYLQADRRRARTPFPE